MQIYNQFQVTTTLRNTSKGIGHLTLISATLLHVSLSLMVGLPANDKVRIFKFLQSNILSTCFATICSDIFIFWVWRQVQPCLPLFILVGLVAPYKAVHADAHHVTPTSALVNTHTRTVQQCIKCTSQHIHQHTRTHSATVHQVH